MSDLSIQFYSQANHRHVHQKKGKINREREGKNERKKRDISRLLPHPSLRQMSTPPAHRPKYRKRRFIHKLKKKRELRRRIQNVLSHEI